MKLKELEYYFQAFKNYFNFRGRANRSEFNWFVLIDLVILFGLIEWVGFIYLLITIVPFFSLNVRRLRDAGCSGYWVLFYFPFCLYAILVNYMQIHLVFPTSLVILYFLSLIVSLIIFVFSMFAKSKRY
ncbi:DUF805 domain-containing protein [Helicobacter sp. 13S00477-4]|uniref:DUF805 domain-containing protein n=1 Tax=Helicobacter sp. 13S00477-4 TaxID=1905759 RepID=UPI000BA79459|nr:DUF805 domain-containing protein [Helicobacter sp. 13S00477-4]PAF52494.1 hypothetical protein BKH44_01555 [Helicobacter sp. 13S00477-4]